MRHLPKILLILIISQLSLKAFSQDNTAKALKNEKVAFLTKKLQLTKEEAKKFWPIYDEYWDKKNKILSNRKRLAEEFIKNVDNLTESQTIEYTNRYVKSIKAESDLISEYNKKLLQILPPKKVMLLYQSNYEFKNYLLKKMQETKK
ncbi:hypothetical protein [Tenuifilum thalassicum]|uniref:Sensor of ECF-type sigma factor n=1 Tax=Tenuifilum thalassicum TaxID=2590900 RepID=A0A7D4AYI1_9BACT|nr:hypothetical protein [Tenuifilum thalassicum]QKG80894.1 hypothetical protein FHG85_11685 [Tenuifilum thalassicum]